MTLKRSLISLSLAVLLTGTVSAAQYGVGTMSQGTLGYAAGSAVSKVISTKSDLRLRVQPFGGTTQVVPLINSGELDFGLASVIEGEAAVNGKVVFKGHPNPNLRAVAVIFPIQVGFFVRKDSGIQSYADLKGKSLPVGYASQAMIASVTESVLAAGGVSSQDMRGVPVPNIVRGADDFSTGKADAFFFAVGAGKVSQVAAKVGDLTLLPIASDKAALSAARAKANAIYIDTIKPSKRNVGVQQPTPVIAYDYLLLAGKHVSDDDIYKATKALYENKAGLIKSMGKFRGFSQAKMVKDISVSYHPGAIKFYKEVGLWNK